MTMPFLFRFKETCFSPARDQGDPSYFYDVETDMVIDGALSPYVPAIESARKPGPPTKKKEAGETGEDIKDRRMWK